MSYALLYTLGKSTVKIFFNKTFFSSNRGLQNCNKTVTSSIRKIGCDIIIPRNGATVVWRRVLSKTHGLPARSSVKWELTLPETRPHWEESESEGFALKTRQMFSAHTSADKFKSGHFGFVLKKPWEGKPHDYLEVLIQFKKLRFQNLFCPHDNEKSTFSNSSSLKIVFEIQLLRFEFVTD